MTITIGWNFLGLVLASALGTMLALMFCWLVLSILDRYHVLL